VTHSSRPPEPEDRELVDRARKGDAQALALLVTRHHGVVYRFLLGFLRDEELAADVTQDTFLKVMARLGGFRGEAAFRTWLLAIARNEALGTIRSRGRRREEPLEEAGRMSAGEEPPDIRAVRADEIQRIRGALDRLPEKQRLSVSLRLFDGLSFRDVGEAIGSSEGAARVNYHYGITRLREWLDDEA
jgi:RNA polymerase sigma-70 factor, ECF subfamily